MRILQPKSLLALFCLLAAAVAVGSLVAGSAFNPSSSAEATPARGSLPDAVDRLTRRAGVETPVRRVVAVPGKPARIERARRGETAAFPLSWVNPLGDRQSVEVVRSWVAPQRFTATRVLLGRRNGRGKLAWRVEGRRNGHAEIWLLAPNGTLLSHRRADAR